jgi:hypothetical protein
LWAQQVSSQDLVFVAVKADAASVVKGWSGTGWAVNTSESGVIESLVACALSDDVSKASSSQVVWGGSLLAFFTGIALISRSKNLVQS